VERLVERQDEVKCLGKAVASVERRDDVKRLVERQDEK